ncbi:hypothetical protein [Kribbella solani]|uniref:Lipoprotein n=1 Tax=Kribbella solani TaxID=236067 RepID=A0A841DPJ0_9ACTN|nr:hypothetical protein [Kribbella solani]MBB5978600.1 hypothetical protein [Kribbella solani]MDX2970581.1 hypothetical protein [Kribbella solani]MDX3004965.1 hypothetical protein [Kribbella solani]
MRRFALPATLLAGVVLVTGCSKGSNDGGLPVPAGGDAGPVTTSATPTAAPTKTSAAPTEPPEPTATKPTAKADQVIVVAGNYATNPAVQGLVSSYPLYFQALVSKDDTILKQRFPSFFYSDVSQGIFDAQRNGWVMRPPGSVVVVGAHSTKDDTIAVQTCRSQTTQYWDPRGKRWTVVTPKGSAEVIEMIKTGVGWLPYRLASAQGVNCAKVHYPA